MSHPNFNVPNRRTFARGLRFRLTLTYVVFFTLSLTFLGAFFRQTLRSIHDTQVHHLLDEEWGAVKGYLRIDKGRSPDWYYDRADPEEALIVDRLRLVFLLTDGTGTVIEVSQKYADLGIDTPEEIHH